jgi:hypothetical protein
LSPYYYKKKETTLITIQLDISDFIKKNKALFIIESILMVTLNCVSFSTAAQTLSSITGQILDKETGRPIQFAAVGLQEQNLWQYTDDHGEFSFNELKTSNQTLVVHCLGYAPTEVQVHLSENENWQQTIYLTGQNLQLQEVVVTATEKQDESGTSVIDQQAMQHLQPSGFGDLLELLPGYRWEQQDLSKVSTIKLRQAGDDDNTAYGTAFYIDGIPLSTDAEVQGNNLSSADQKLSGRLHVAKGIDLRQIATDDIERVEIIRGVPSVKHGNLSTGAVIIHRKWGATPLQIRVKTDLKNKVFAINKGFYLNKDKGIINVSSELLSYRVDPRNPLETFLRNQSALKYANHYHVGNSTLSLKTSLDYLLTIDREKEDPELNHGLKDDYRSDRSNARFNLQGDLIIPGRMHKTVALKLSADYNRNTLIRERLVSLTGPLPQPTSLTEGKSDGQYLPSRYLSEFERDDQPFSAYASIDFTLSGTTEKLRHQFNSGVDGRYLKNFGKGDLFDITHPIFPSQGGRPYDFSTVPALQNVSWYAEEVLTALWGRHTLKFQPGIRMSTLPGLANDFAMHGKVYTDWRGHLNYTMPVFNLNARPIKISFHAAIGEMTRMPTLAHLYPQQEYTDIVELNYYSQTPELRRLYVMTQIQDVTNYALQPVQNLKKEIGLDVKIGQSRFSTTLFEEQMDNGIVSASNFKSYTYNHYDPSSVSSEELTGPPALELFTIEERARLFNYSQYVNGSALNKRGVEYQFISPRIEEIKTRITINGAWFLTRYDSSLPEYVSRSFYYNGTEYPYVGIFAKGNNSEEKELLNTNLQLDTHLPQHRLLVTVAVQTTWYQKRRDLPYDAAPVGYLDNYGQYFHFTEADKEDSMLRLLMYTFTPYRFDTEKKAMDLGVNLKVRKEIGDHLSFSFYVNRLLNYLPDYKIPSGATMKRNESPYFGMELKLEI